MNKINYYTYSSLAVAGLAIGGIILSPSIPITLGITAVASCYGLFSKSQIEKEKEKELAEENKEINKEDK